MKQEMISQQHIEQVYADLNARCQRLRMAALRNLLRGTLKPGQIAIAATAPADDDALTLERAERAFKQHTCVVLTAFRGGYTLDENIARNQLLKPTYSSMGSNLTVLPAAIVRPTGNIPVKSTATLLPMKDNPMPCSSSQGSIGYPKDTTRIASSTSKAVSAVQRSL